MIREGKYITSNQFYSCSIIKQTAEAFAGNGILMIIKTRFAIEIGNDSVYPDEREYVIPPGMFLEIVSSNKKNNSQMYDELTLKLAEVKICTNVNPDLVLDMSRCTVSVQLYNGSAKQKWIIQGHYIRSCHNGYIMDKLAEYYFLRCAAEYIV
jgi:hypothetical protein